MSRTGRRTRIAPLPCPHCDDTRPTPHHYRDTGNLDATEAQAAGYCPQLAARRNWTPGLSATKWMAQLDAATMHMPSPVQS